MSDNFSLFENAVDVFNNSCAENKAQTCYNACGRDMMYKCEVPYLCYNYCKCDLDCEAYGDCCFDYWIYCKDKNNLSFMKYAPSSNNPKYEFFQNVDDKLKSNSSLSWFVKFKLHDIHRESDEKLIHLRNILVV